MIKKISIILIILFLIILIGCGAKTSETEAAVESMFVIIEENFGWQVVYHRDTKVMYAVSNGSYNRGGFTLLVDSDGNPLLYEGGNSND